MNQILNIPKQKSYMLFLKLQLIFSSILLFFSFCYLCILIFFNQNRNEVSSQLLDNYHIFFIFIDYFIYYFTCNLIEKSI